VEAPVVTSSRGEAVVVGKWVKATQRGATWEKVREESRKQKAASREQESREGCHASPMRRMSYSTWSTGFAK
jgi:hypothetical protein